MGSSTSQLSDSEQSSPSSYFGDYRCRNCGRTWTSTLSWPDAYQKCKHCNTVVYPHKQRPVMPDDFQRDGNRGHPQELCERCVTLGYYCARHADQHHRQTENGCVIL